MTPGARFRELLRAISRPPSAGWRDAGVHHGFRALFVLAIGLALPWLFPRPSLTEFEGLEIGEVADRDVVADVSFTVYKPTQQLQAEQRDAERGQAPIFRRDRSVADSAMQRVRRLFASIDSLVLEIEARAAEDPEGDDQAEIVRRVHAGITEALAGVNVTFPTSEQLALLANPGQRRRLASALIDALGELSETDVARSMDVEDVASQNVVVREDRDRVLSMSSIVTMDEFYQRPLPRVGDELPGAGVPLFSTLLVVFAQPTLTLDHEATRETRRQAREAVERAADFVQQGQRIITAYQPISTEDRARLDAYQDRLLERGLAEAGTGFWRSLGIVLFGTGLLGILAFSVFSFRREIYEDARSFSLIFMLVFVVLLVASVIATTDSPSALIPIAFAALIVAALFDSLLALLVVATIAGLVLGQPTFEGLEAPVITAAGGVSAAFAVREIRRRTQSWILIAVITGGYFVTALALLLMGHLNLGELAVTTLFGFGNATACTALAMGAALPLLETFTRRTTEQTLLELADMNRPLLRRLAREAPGTYAHSINMANLVEAACSAIGADSTLARVGVYYHDVGKLARPQYFIENQPKGLNPHDRLRPAASAEILREHVREGLKLAENAKLPPVIKDFIREHHGTQQIRYFLAKAREEEPDLDLDPNEFCYPGPKPQSKETGVAMLADAVESASRTLAEPTPERIRALIEKLVSIRVEEGQLDECGLTFRDLDVVKSQFAHVLTGLYHHRIDYPEPSAGERERATREPQRTTGSGEPPPVDPDAGTQPGLGAALAAAAAGSASPAGPGGAGRPVAPRQLGSDDGQAAASDTGPPPELDPEPAGTSGGRSSVHPAPGSDDA